MKLEMLLLMYEHECGIRTRPFTLRKRPPYPGTVFGRWTTTDDFELTEIKKQRSLLVYCKCSCGKERYVAVSSLLSGSTLSCGCLRKDLQKANHAKVHGMARTRLYRTWKHMNGRCHTSTDTSFVNYGGRGITVCAEWRDSFVSFRDWALDHGYRNDLTIERINNDYGYSPNNCRWATRKDQAHNTRRNFMITAFGETKCLVEWARDPRCAGSSYIIISKRIKRGVPPEIAITTRRA